MLLAPKNPERDRRRSRVTRTAAAGAVDDYSRGIDPGFAAQPATVLLLAKIGHRSVVDRAQSGGTGTHACFAEAAGVTEVLAGGPIRGGLQAHPTVPRVAERSPRAAYARVAAGPDEWP
jgi:hypothetical protein